jgi:hypothetical protein
MSMARRFARKVRSTLAHPNAVAQRGMTMALAALYGSEPGPTGDDALAEREQRRREDEARRAGQGVLVLREAKPAS